MKKAFLVFSILTCWFAALAQMPTATDDTVVVSKNSNTILDVTGNDNANGSGSLSVTILDAPQHGAAAIINQNQVNYVPKAFYYGKDTFTYIVCNSNSQCDTATVYVSITGSNIAPVAVDDDIILQDTVTNTFLYVDTNDFDPEGGPFFISAAINSDAGSELGSISLDPFTGHILFTRSPLACGSDSFQYAICDTFAVCDTGLIYITINCPDVISHPQGFSPNGDGKNDKLVFSGLEYFSPARLRVYNRYGNTIYESDDYQNDWEGHNRDNNRPLPDGTYYYTLELPNKQKYVSYLVITH